MKYFLIVFLVLSLTNCDVPQRQLSSSQTQNKDFALDTTYFETNGNNIAKNAIQIEDGYIITGQKFTYTDSVTSRCALLKISPKGKILKHSFYGNNRRSNYSKSETIYRINNGKIIQVGEKKDQMWIREIDEDLNVLKDTVFPIGINALFQPNIVIKEKEFVVISNNSSTSEGLIDVSFVSNNLKNLEYVPIQRDPIKFNYENYNVVDMVHNPSTDILYILGGGCLTKDVNGNCENYDNSLIVYNLHSKKIEHVFHFENKEELKSIRLHKNYLYVAGHIAKGKKIPIEDNEETRYHYQLMSYDYYVAKFNLQGKRLNEFNVENEKMTSRLLDMEVFDNTFLTVGFTSSFNPAQNFGSYLSIDFKGKTIKKNDSYAHNTRDNMFVNIIKLSESKVMILGQGGGAWRVIIDDIKHK